MRPLLICSLIFAGLVNTLHYSLASTSLNPTNIKTTLRSAKTASQVSRSLQNQQGNPSKPILQPVGRSLQFPNYHEDTFELAPIQVNFEGLPDYALPPFAPHPLDFGDAIDVGPTHPFSPIIVPQPMNDPLDAREEIMEPEGRQIVFRPLFAYRRQTAQRRRNYSKPPSSNSYGYGQRRRQGQPYRYSSYRYPHRYSYYPDYYNNAPYDYVP